MNHVMIQEAEFTAGEYGELVLHGQPVISELFVDFYPRDVFPVDIGAGVPRRVVDGPPGEAMAAEGKAGKASRAAASAAGVDGGAEGAAEGVEEMAAAAEEAGVDMAGLEAALGEPHMELYWSNDPRGGWKLVGTFKAHSYHSAARKARFFRIIHPVGCPFDGRVVAFAK